MAVFKMSEQQLIEKIDKIKESMGDKLMILTHHYQRKEIVELGDYAGDSFGLSQKAAKDKNAKNIVFCGVHFMAESAAILCSHDQIVQIPDFNAGCPMADMADEVSVQRAWDEICAITHDTSMTPIVYMNSDASLKAFCGRNGGTVCTSSNAPAAFEWGLKQREKIIFFPDRHLGENTAHNAGIPPEEVIVWDPGKKLGGNTPEIIQNAKVIVWEGFCHVHTHFTTDHILQMREQHPDAKIVVHPECPREVVELADAAGSTSFIGNYVREAPTGATIIIGTEYNMIERLALENQDRCILALYRSLCPNMAKITLEKLLWTLNNLSEVNVVTVDDEIRKDAGAALQQMLKLQP